MTANDLRKEIVRISRLFYERGWSRATSGNYSARYEKNRILITASGKDKGLLSEEDLISLDPDGRIVEETANRPSAEAHLHCELYKWQPEIQAVLHTHSVFSTLISSDPGIKAPLTIEGYEMLKAFRGVTTHQHTESIPVFANDQDMKNLAELILQQLRSNPAVHGFLISGHGLYSWGSSLEEALRHVEAFEFLLECEYRKLKGGL